MAGVDDVENEILDNLDASHESVVISEHASQKGEEDNITDRKADPMFPGDPIMGATPQTGGGARRKVYMQLDASHRRAVEDQQRADFLQQVRDASIYAAPPYQAAFGANNNQAQTDVMNALLTRCNTTDGLLTTLLKRLEIVDNKIDHNQQELERKIRETDNALFGVSGRVDRLPRYPQQSAYGGLQSSGNQSTSASYGSSSVNMGDSDSSKSKPEKELRRKSTVPLFDVPVEIEANNPPALGANPNATFQTQKIPARLPKEFAGTEWRERLTDFMRLARTNGWDTETMKIQLFASCRGPAKTATKHFDLVQGTFEELVQELTEVFDTTNTTDRLAAFRTYVQKADDNINIYAMNVVQKLDEALPIGDERMKARFALDQFITGLRNAEQKKYVFLNAPPTMHEAINLANRWDLNESKFGTQESGDLKPEKENIHSIQNPQKQHAAIVSAQPKKKFNKRKQNKQKSKAESGTKSDSASGNTQNITREDLKRFMEGTKGGFQKRGKPNRGNKGESGKFSNAEKDPKACFLCGKRGHWMSKCKWSNTARRISSLLDTPGSDDELEDSEEDNNSDF